MNSILGRRARLLAAATASALALVVAGCSSGASNAPDEAQQKVVEEYFNAFATQKSTTMEPMLKASAEGSPAHIYAQHQIGAVTAQESAGEGPEPDVVEYSSGEVKYRAKLPEDATEQEVADATSVYSGFEFSPEGQLTTWTTSDGGALASRISLQSGKAEADGVTVQLKTSYVTNGGDLALTYDVKNKGKKKVSVYMKGYQNADGREVKLTNTPSTMDPGSGAFLSGYSSVTNGKAGGTLLVEFDYQTTKKIKVKAHSG